MAVTSMTIRCGPTPKRRPQIGDTKIGKDGVEFVRRQVYTRDGGQWCAHVRGSRPVCEWVPVGTPQPWEIS